VRKGTRRFLENKVIHNWIALLRRSWEKEFEERMKENGSKRRGGNCRKEDLLLKNTFVCRGWEGGTKRGEEVAKPRKRITKKATLG